MNPVSFFPVLCGPHRGGGASQGPEDLGVYRHTHLPPCGPLTKDQGSELDRIVPQSSHISKQDQKLITGIIMVKNPCETVLNQDKPEKPRVKQSVESLGFVSSIAILSFLVRGFCNIDA